MLTIDIDDDISWNVFQRSFRLCMSSETHTHTHTLWRRCNQVSHLTLTICPHNRCCFTLCPLICLQFIKIRHNDFFYGLLIDEVKVFRGVYTGKLYALYYACGYTCVRKPGSLARRRSIINEWFVLIEKLCTKRS